jgi:hypothetical protein
VELVADAAERTTAATDAVLALAALAVIATVRRRTPPSFPRAIWTAALAALAAASALAAAAHGLALAESARERVWQPLWLTLGVMIALFVVGALHSWRGDRAARAGLWPMLAVALAFYLASGLAGGSFLIFVVYEAIGLLFALLVYLGLARDRRPGALAVAVALGISLAAGGIQATAWEVEFAGCPFDHNALFHLVQLAGLPVLAIGLRRLLTPISAAGTA